MTPLEIESIKNSLDKNTEATNKILQLLQGDLGKKGLVHVVGEIHETVQIHKEEVAQLKKDVEQIKHDKKTFVAILGTGAGLVGSGLAKIVTKLSGGTE